MWKGTCFNCGREIFQKLSAGIIWRAHFLTEILQSHTRKVSRANLTESCYWDLVNLKVALERRASAKTSPAGTSIA